MNKKLLVKNPEVNLSVIPSGLIQTSWDKDSFWPTQDFNFSKIKDLDSSVSPFFLIEGKISFLLSLLFNDSPTLFSGLQSLASCLFYLRSEAYFYTDSYDKKKWEEYTNKKYTYEKEYSYTQAVFLDCEANLLNFSKHGRVILASRKSLPSLLSGFISEKTWSYQENSEIGEFYVHSMCR